MQTHTTSTGRSTGYSLRVPPELMDEPLAQECPPTEGADQAEWFPPAALNS